MAQNIQHYMNERGISRKELASQLCLSYTTLSSWLQGDSYPRIDKIEKMANYFGITKADLVEDSSKVEAKERPKVKSLARRMNKLSDDDLDLINDILDKFDN